MKTRKIIFTALFAALSCVATMVIKLPTPTMGYIHPGDAVVLLSGLLLGPIYGGLAAGIGSMFADIFSGYLAYAPATFVIKALTAVIAAYCAKLFNKLFAAEKKRFSMAAILLSGCLGEAFMVLGYFIFEIFLLAASTGDGLSSASLTAGITASASGIPFNIVQGIFGVIIAAIVYPIIEKPFHQMEGVS